MTSQNEKFSSSNTEWQVEIKLRMKQNNGQIKEKSSF